MKFYLALLCFMTISFCQAQTIMPRLGVTMNGAINPVHYYDYEKVPLAGFVAGAEAQFEIGKRFGIAADLLFVQKGWATEFLFATQATDVDVKEAVQVNFVDLLCLPLYRISDFYFMVGPGLGYGINGKINQLVTPAGGATSSYDLKIQFIDEPQNASPERTQYMTRRWSGSFTVGAGVTVWKRLLIDLRYQLATMDSYSSTGHSMRPLREEKRDAYQSLQLTSSLRLSGL